MGLVNIAVGPQHPALKEPINFSFQTDGERIVSADARIGYAHRGIEKGMEQNNYVQGLFLTERICGICSHAHSMSYVMAVEEAMKIEPPKRAQYIRCIVGELERLHSHLLWIGVAAHEVGFDTVFMYSWKDREVVMDILERLSGNRVNYAINIFGGVKRDIDAEQAKDILKKIEKLEKRLQYYIDIGEHEPSFVARFKDVGVLTSEQASSLGAVGPTARGSGVTVDHRKDDIFAIYHEIDFTVCIEQAGDALARYIVRARELVESCKIIRQLLEKMPEGEIKVKHPRKAGPAEVVARYEAPRGEDVHYLWADGSDKPFRYKVRAPTLAAIPATLEMFKNAHVADIPVIIASIDPCISCTDRAIALTDSRTGSTMSWKELRDFSNRWYADRSRR
ncbi:MAG TPA: nickel-dependent hydrogenase large subunit [bacterium]|nr:nickel-dependent hydrogenase large subunit [bacterium]